MDWNKLPKQFCDRTACAFADESFFVVMMAGTSGTAYAMNPKHAKAFLKSLQHNIDKYEKQFGEIESDWQPGVKSPIQPSDLSAGKEPPKKKD